MIFCRMSHPQLRKFEHFVRKMRLLYMLRLLFAFICCSLSGLVVGQERNARDELIELQRITQTLNPQLDASTVALIANNGTTGSGVIVSAEGLILTAAHVVQGNEKMTAIFADGHSEIVEVLGANYTRDAAVVKLKGKDAPYPFISMGDSDVLHYGQFVIALGHAKGFDPTRPAPVRLGRILAKPVQSFLISECKLVGGDSGGPLFNLAGELIGIHSSIGPQLNLNNHVPVSAFKKDWERLIKGDQWGQLGANPMQDPEAPMLGLMMMMSPTGRGVMVEGVVDKSPAAELPLLPGDILLAFAGKRIGRPIDLLKEMEQHHPGETVEIQIFRAGQMYKAQLKLGRLGDYLPPEEPSVQPVRPDDRKAVKP